MKSLKTIILDPLNNIHGRLTRIEYAIRDNGLDTQEFADGSREDAYQLEKLLSEVSAFCEDIDDQIEAFLSVGKELNPNVEEIDDTYLNRPKGLDFINLSTDEMAKYADVVLVKNINDKRFLDLQLKDLDPDDWSQFHKWNATSLGNLAFVSLNAELDAHRDLASNTLNSYKDFLKELGVLS